MVDISHTLDGHRGVRPERGVARLVSPLSGARRWRGQIPAKVCTVNVHLAIH
jgi:hypothetical protein